MTAALALTQDTPRRMGLALPVAVTPSESEDEFGMSSVEDEG